MQQHLHAKRYGSAIVLAALFGIACQGGREGRRDGPDAAPSESDSGDDPSTFDCTVAGSAGPRTLRLLTRREYANTVHDLLGVESPDVATIPIEATIAGYTNNAQSAVVTSRHVDAFMGVAESVADQAVQLDLTTLVGCMPEDPSCRTNFVTRLGRRAFRRELEADEVQRYAALFAAPETQGDFYAGVKLVVRGMLMSPSFLYRSELGESVDDGVYELTGFEIASALAYTFWGTMPDDALLDAAARGDLDRNRGVEQEARRLLADPRARIQLGEFATEWIGTRSLLQANKDPQIYPSFNDNVRQAMDLEFRTFFEHVVLDSSHSLRELLTADYVFVNDALAGFYGLPNPGSSELVRVAVDPQSSRGGLLTLGAVLASHAHANMSAPVQRGVFVRERLLCEELVPPPPDLDTTPPGLDPNLTTRERFSRHSEDPMCSGCHRSIDPIGFSFERYDGVGGYREVENGRPVDDSGSLLQPGIGERAYNGPKGLAQLLADEATVSACAVEQLYTFVHGREPDAADECALEELGDGFEASEHDLFELLIDVTLNDSFTQRRG